MSLKKDKYGRIKQKGGSLAIGRTPYSYNNIQLDSESVSFDGSNIVISWDGNNNISYTKPSPSVPYVTWTAPLWDGDKASFDGIYNMLHTFNPAHSRMVKSENWSKMFVVQITSTESLQHIYTVDDFTAGGNYYTSRIQMGFRYLNGNMQFLMWYNSASEQNVNTSAVVDVKIPYTVGDKDIIIIGKQGNTYYIASDTGFDKMDYNGTINTHSNECIGNRLLSNGTYFPFAGHIYEYYHTPYSIINPYLYQNGDTINSPVKPRRYANLLIDANSYRTRFDETTGTVTHIDGTNGILFNEDSIFTQNQLIFRNGKLSGNGQNRVVKGFWDYDNKIFSNDVFSIVCDFEIANTVSTSEYMFFRGLQNMGISRENFSYLLYVTSTEVFFSYYVGGGVSDPIITTRAVHSGVGSYRFIYTKYYTVSVMLLVSEDNTIVSKVTNNTGIENLNQHDWTSLGSVGDSNNGSVIYDRGLKNCDISRFEFYKDTALLDVDNYDNGDVLEGTYSPAKLTPHQILPPQPLFRFDSENRAYGVARPLIDKWVDANNSGALFKTAKNGDFGYSSYNSPALSVSAIDTNTGNASMYSDWSAMNVDSFLIPVKFTLANLNSQSIFRIGDADLTSEYLTSNTLLRLSHDGSNLVYTVCETTSESDIAVPVIANVEYLALLGYDNSTGTQYLIINGAVHKSATGFTSLNSTYLTGSAGMDLVLHSSAVSPSSVSFSEIKNYPYQLIDVSLYVNGDAFSIAEVKEQVDKREGVEITHRDRFVIENSGTMITGIKELVSRGDAIIGGSPKLRNSYISYTNNDYIRHTFTNTQTYERFSMSAWVRTDRTAQLETAFFNTLRYIGDKYGFELYDDTILCYTGNGSIDVNYQIVDNNWYHVHIEYYPLGFDIYVNGKKYYTGTILLSEYEFTSGMVLTLEGDSTANVDSTDNTIHFYPTHYTDFVPEPRSINV